MVFCGMGVKINMSLSRWMDLGGLEAGASLAGLGSVVCPVW